MLTIYRYEQYRGSVCLYCLILYNEKNTDRRRTFHGLVRVAGGLWCPCPENHLNSPDANHLSYRGRLPVLPFHRTAYYRLDGLSPSVQMAEQGRGTAHSRHRSVFRKLIPAFAYGHKSNRSNYSFWRPFFCSWLDLPCYRSLETMKRKATSCWQLAVGKIPGRLIRAILSAASRQLPVASAPNHCNNRPRPDLSHFSLPKNTASLPFQLIGYNCCTHGIIIFVAITK